MTIWVGEYSGFAYAAGQRSPDILQDPPLAVTQISSGNAVSTFFAGANTRILKIVSDAAGAWVLCGASSTSSTTVTSTNSMKIPAGVPDIRGVTPNCRITALST